MNSHDSVNFRQKIGMRQMVTAASHLCSAKARMTFIVVLGSNFGAFTRFTPVHTKNEPANLSRL